MNTLKIQEIQAFLAVCQYGTFSAAAERTYTTQPTVSWQITSLEKELGVQLFVRGRGLRRLTLTEEGQLFFGQAKKLFKLWHETEQMLSRGAKQYRFGCVPSMTDWLFPQIMRCFQEKWPECDLEQWDRTSEQLCLEVRQGRMDTALIVKRSAAENLSVLPIVNEDMLFVCRRNSGYEGTQHVRELPVSRQVSFYFTEEMKEWERNYLNQEETPLVTVTSVRRPSDFFTVSDAWGIVPATYFAMFPKDFISLPLDVQAPQRPFFLISREPPREPYYSAIQDTLRETFKRKKGMHLIQSNHP